MNQVYNMVLLHWYVFCVVFQELLDESQSFREMFDGFIQNPAWICSYIPPFRGINVIQLDNIILINEVFKIKHSFYDINHPVERKRKKIYE